MNNRDPKEYFEQLTSKDAYVLKAIHNDIGQLIRFVEHPVHGDEHPVIAMFPDYGVAFDTTFFDCGDFYRGSDYLPHLMPDGQMKWKFEIGAR